MDWQLYQRKFEEKTFTVDDVEPFLRDYQNTNAFIASSYGLGGYDFMNSMIENRDVFAEYFQCRPDQILFGNYDARMAGDEVIPYVAVMGHCDAKKALELKSTGDLRYVGGFLDVSDSGLKDFGNIEWVGADCIVRNAEINNLDNLKHAGRLRIDDKSIDISHIEIGDKESIVDLSGLEREQSSKDPITWKEFLASRKDYRVDNVRAVAEKVRSGFDAYTNTMKSLYNRVTEFRDRINSSIEEKADQLADAIEDKAVQLNDTIDQKAQTLAEKIDKGLDVLREKIEGFIEKLNAFNKSLHSEITTAKLRDVQDLSNQIEQLQGMVDRLVEQNKALREEIRMNSAEPEYDPIVNEQSFNADSRVQHILPMQDNVVTGPPVYGTEMKEAVMTFNENSKKHQPERMPDGSFRTHDGKRIPPIPSRKDNSAPEH